MKTFAMRFFLRIAVVDVVVVIVKESQINEANLIQRGTRIPL